MYNQTEMATPDLCKTEHCMSYYYPLNYQSSYNDYLNEQECDLGIYAEGGECIKSICTKVDIAYGNIAFRRTKATCKCDFSIKNSFIAFGKQTAIFP